MDEFRFVRDCIDQVEETEFGFIRKRWHPEHFTKRVWFEATRTVAGSAQTTEEYALASHLLRQAELDEDSAKLILETFTERITNKFFETNVGEERRGFIDAQLQLIDKHVKGETFTLTSEIKLLGVTAPVNGAHFEVDGLRINLRRTVLEDLEKERIDLGHRERVPRDPSAILKIQFEGFATHELQPIVEQAITILRLFKVGSVSYLSYSMESDSLNEFFKGFFSTPGINSSLILGGLSRCEIADEDVTRLEKFWRAMTEVLPPDGYDRRASRVEPLMIAYQQYADATLILSSSVERRISDAVMGLESLFLTRQENQELAYRLRMRVAKMFSVLGADPYSAKRIANDAYTVRSAFVHGDNVRDEDKKQIDKRYGNFGSLAKLILEQLRVTIVMLTLTKISKDDFIRLLDDSFIDSNKLPELEKLLVPIREFIR